VNLECADRAERRRGSGFYPMNSDRIVERLASLNFRQAVWLFPIAYTLHVLEELPQFTSWARRYASPAFTMRDYLVIHLIGIVLAFMSPMVIRWFPNRAVIFVFFTLIFTPAVCFNILFHAGATAAFGAYSPGLLTALTLYPPLFYVVTRQVFREGLLTNRTAAISLVLAGLVHAADVSHNVFKAW
jgi:hypothetical protein